MNSQIMRSTVATVIVVRLSADENEEKIVVNDILCLISAPVKGQYDYWTAHLAVTNRDIRKGDILRRADGSELQVLRIVTRKLPGFGKVTRLDLKDYQEPPLQENEVDVSESGLPEHELHPVIAQKVWGIFLQGNYDLAVFQAFKQVEIAVREAGGYAENDHGTDLMRKAFNVGTGNLTDQSRLPAVKQAMSDLFAGAIGLYKNPSSHHEVEFAPEEAAEIIIIASHLLRIVDSCEQSEDD